MEHDKEHSYQLVLMVRNRPGVLVRCTQVLSRRGQNIESLQVNTVPGQLEYSKMIIAASGNLNVMNQVRAQLNKLIDVVNIN